MSVQITVGDAIQQLRVMPDESVHCVVTSPPYYGLRDYGTASWEGGDPACNHKQGRPGSGRADGIVDERSQRNRDGVGSMGGDCAKCGARRVDAQIGLEPTLDAYVARLVEVFREVRRVLRQDGTLWLNLGDSYATGAVRAFSPGGGDQGERYRAMGAKVPDNKNPNSGILYQPNRMPQPGLKPKDLCGIPWRVAFALQDDGWWLRSDIIWAKPNPMPESVTDRPTKAHEYLFLLSKSERYYYDADAIRETAGEDPGPGVAGWAVGDDHTAVGHNVGDRSDTHARYKRQNAPDKIKSPHGQGFTRRAKHGERPEDYDRLNRRQDDLHDKIGRKGNANGFRSGSYVNGEPGRRQTTGNVPNETFSRNKRSVWTVATVPYSEAHFATFPPSLIEPCIKAGCPEGGTVFDPFGGAGTTGLVADRLNRNAILIELNPAYAEMARRRIYNDAPLFADVAG